MKPSKPAPGRGPDEHEVGYGRPPKSSQFKPGKSGNPRGRPRGRKNLTTVIRDYAQGRMWVTEGGRDKTLPRFDALQRTMWTQAFKLNPKALAFVLQSLRDAGLLKEEPQAPEPEMTTEDETVLRDYLRRQGVEIDGTANPSSVDKNKTASGKKRSRRRS